MSITQIAGWSLGIFGAVSFVILGGIIIYLLKKGKQDEK
jgi:hypothetical protein